MASAKWTIFQLHTACAVLDIFVTLMLSLYIWIPSPAGYPVGLMTYFGISSSTQLYAGVNSLLAVGLAILIFFENRYDILVVGTTRRSEHRNLKRLIYFLANFAYCSAALVYICMHFPDPEEGRVHVHEHQSCIPMELVNNPNFFIMNTSRTEVVALTASMCILILFQCAYFVLYTVYHLFFVISNLSKTTQKIQRKFFFALSLQVIIPLVAIASPLSYYFIAWKFRYYNQKCNNYAMILVGFNGLFTTIVMILAHQPYRQAAFNVFRTKQIVITSVRVMTLKPSRINV